MSLRFFASVFVVAFAVAIPDLSHAQSASVEDADARTLFNLGQAAFDQGRYQAAIDYFQQAYDLSHRPQLLYNIGQAADRLRDDRRALAAFEGFLREVPDSPHHPSTRARVEVLRTAVATADARELEARTVAEAATTTNTAQANESGAAPALATSGDPEEAGGGSTAGWIVAGIGGGALIAGATFFALGMHDKSTVENAEDGSTYASVSDAYDRASMRITVGSILMGVGAAAGATGIVLALRGGDSHADTAALELRVHANGLVLRRVF